MFPHSLTLQLTWTRGECRISPRTATIEWTRVHAIIKSARAKKGNLSGCDQRLTCCHVEPLQRVRSSSRVHRIRVIGRLRFFTIGGTMRASDFFYRMVVIAGNLGDAWSLPVRPILIERTASRSRSSSRSSSIGRRTLIKTESTRSRNHGHPLT